MIEQAAVGEQSEWRAANIGEGMDALGFADMVEEIWEVEGIWEESKC